MSVIFYIFINWRSPHDDVAFAALWLSRNYSVHHRGLSLSKTGNNISIPALQIHWENSYLCTGK